MRAQSGQLDAFNALFARYQGREAADMQVLWIVAPPERAAIQSEVSRRLHAALDGPVETGVPVVEARRIGADVKRSSRSSGVFTVESLLGAGWQR